LECMPSLLIERSILKSRMNREVHVRFCEEQGVKFPLLTRLCAVLLLRGNNSYDSSKRFIINRIKFRFIINSKKINFFLRSNYISDNSGAAAFNFPFAFYGNPNFISVIT